VRIENSTVAITSHLFCAGKPSSLAEPFSPTKTENIEQEGSRATSDSGKSEGVVVVLVVVGREERMRMASLAFLAVLQRQITRGGGSCERFNAFLFVWDLVLASVASTILSAPNLDAVSSANFGPESEPEIESGPKRLR